MESEGPYSVKNYKYRWCIAGLDEEHNLNQFRYKKWAEWWASQLNTARAEGRKSIMPALEKAEMALKDVHDGYLDATPDGSTFFDWIVWDRLATEALSAIRYARGKK